MPRRRTIKQDFETIIAARKEREAAGESGELIDRLPASHEAAVAVTPVTLAEFGSLQSAYDFYNRVLFGGALRDVLITHLHHAHMRGHYYHDRYASRGDGTRLPQLAMNPDAYIDRTDRQIVSTLVHEQCHVWQFQFGKPSGSYHNKQWAAKMESIGLMPSSTGAVGGRRTGSKVTHYVIEGGPFDKAFDELEATGWKLDLESAPQRVSDRKKLESKSKFVCDACAQIVRGKPSTGVVCAYCYLARLESDGDEAQILKAREYLMSKVGADVPIVTATPPADDRIHDESPSLSAH